MSGTVSLFSGHVESMGKVKRAVVGWGLAAWYSVHLHMQDHRFHPSTLNRVTALPWCHRPRALLVVLSLGTRCSWVQGECKIATSWIFSWASGSGGGRSMNEYQQFQHHPREERKETAIIAAEVGRPDHVPE